MKSSNFQYRIKDSEFMVFLSQQDFHYGDDEVQTINHGIVVNLFDGAVWPAYSSDVEAVFNLRDVLIGEAPIQCSSMDLVVNDLIEHALNCPHHRV